MDDIKESPPKISRRDFLRVAGLAAAGTAVAACAKTGKSEPGKEKKDEKPAKATSDAKPPTVTPSPSPLPAETKELDPKKELEKKLVEIIKPVVAEFFEKYGRDLPEAARVEVEENGDLPPAQPWADNLGDWYKDLMKHTGSDSGVYEKMTMDETSYRLLMIDQRAGLPLPDEDEKLERLAATTLFDFNIEHTDTNVYNIAIATKMVYQYWQELVPEKLKELKNSKNVRALALLYSFVSLGIRENLVRNSFQLDQATTENNFTETESLFFDYAQLIGMDKIYTPPPEVFMLTSEGAEKLPRGAYFKPKRGTGTPVTTEPETAPTREEAPPKETELTPTPQPKIEAEKPVEKKPKIIADIKEAYRASQETELKIQEHGYKHEDLHWQTVKTRIGMKKEDEFEEKHKHIEPLAVVVHYTAGGTTEQCIKYLSCSNREEVIPSVQFVVGKDGIVHQIFDQEDYVEFHDGGPNPVAFGIEMVADDADDVSAEQLIATTRLIDYLKKEYGISYVSSHQNAHLLAKELLKQKPTLAQKKVRVIPQSKPDPGKKNMEIIFELLEATNLKFLKADVPNQKIGAKVVHVPES